MPTSEAPTRIAVTGHRGLPDDTVNIVDTAIRTAVRNQPKPLVGITCLADGADQIFARAIIDAGGALHVIVPAQEYRDGLPAEAHAPYDELIARAANVRRLPYVASTSEAHMAASKTMLDDVDTLFAVWDGQPARGYGGTADIVTIAHDLNIPVHIIWPAGAHRD